MWKEKQNNKNDDDDEPKTSEEIKCKVVSELNERKRDMSQAIGT